MSKRLPDDVASKEADKEASKEFADQAEQPQVGLVREFFEFLRYNKKWWLAPIIVILLVLGLFVVLSGTWLAPFIYPL